jgi:hypothetical protein
MMLTRYSKDCAYNERTEYGKKEAGQAVTVGSL